MATVLTTDSSMMCGTQMISPPLHGGKIVPAPGSSKLTVDGNPVLRSSDVSGKVVTGCTTAPPPPSNKACGTVIAVTAGTATKLTIDGTPVLLNTINGTTDGSPIGPLAADARQTKLTAI